MTTTEAMNAGMAVLDGGATRAVGSVRALEALMQQNQNLKGHTGIGKVDPTERPTFSFGNSSVNQCLSTAEVQLEAGGHSGKMSVHTLNVGQGPILISVQTLRALGAVLDFSNDLVCFRGLDPTRIIPLQRSSTGHQLISLAHDLYKQALPANRAVPSLQEFLQCPEE